MRAFQLIRGTRQDKTKLPEINIGRVLQVNRRIGDLMQEGREQMGICFVEFGNRFGVSCFEVQRWESGFGTLQASLFAEIAPHFSQDIQWKFQLLINEIQRESRNLSGFPECIHELVENFDALGVAHAIAA